jgi:hypothetical protein
MYKIREKGKRIPEKVDPQHSEMRFLFTRCLNKEYLSEKADDTYTITNPEDTSQLLIIFASN